MIRNLVYSLMMVGLIIGAPATSNAAPITNWKVLNNPPNSTSGLNTDSPVFGDGVLGSDDVDTTNFAGKFTDGVSLGIGQTMTVSGDVLLTGGLNPIADGLGYRFGVFDDGGAFDADSTTFASGWLYAVGGAGPNGDAALYQGRTDGAYGSIFGNSVELSTTQVSSGAFNADSTALFSWSYEVTRTGAGTVDLVGKISGGDGSLDQTYSVDNVGTGNFDFTAIGWLITSAADLDQISFSNVQVNVIPEPASLMLAAFGIAGLALRRKNRTAA